MGQSYTGDCTKLKKLQINLCGLQKGIKDVINNVR